MRRCPSARASDPLDLSPITQSRTGLGWRAQPPADGLPLGAAGNARHVLVIAASQATDYLYGGAAGIVLVIGVVIARAFRR